MSSHQQLVFDPKNPPETLPISQIIIGDRFRQDLGDLASLVSSIKEIGLLHPIVIDENRKLIAGRRRLASCEILDWDEIPIRVVNLDDLIQGEFHENHVRKDFTKKEVLAIHHALTPKLKEESKVNSLNNLKQNHRSAESAPRKNKKSRDIIAEYAGLSHDSISKLEDIEQESKTNPEYDKLLEDIDNDSKKETINSVFKKLQKERKRKERHEQLKKIQVKLPEKVQLFNQPFQQNQIKDNSVSLIFTDPPYDHKSLYLYEELAKQAIKVLRNGGSLMCYIGHCHKANHRHDGKTRIKVSLARCS